MKISIPNLIKLIILAGIILLSGPVHSQSTDEQYQAAIESADSYFEQGDYLNAKASYQVAAGLKPDEQYPKDRLKESISLLRVQMQQSALYNDKINFADRLFEEQSFEKAITAYEEALKVMPAEDYPQQQIAKINKIREEEAANEAMYAALLSEGDALFASENFKGARAKYEEARNIYPARDKALDKLQLTDQRLEEIAAQQSGYQKAISQAEMYHARKDYENELKAYEEAVALKPNEALPQVKIRELNDFLRQYESYNAFVSKADELYINKQYEKAKLEYQKALEVLPDEPYPKEIISKINLALAEKTEKDRAAYEEALAKADALYNQEDYESAMQAYSEALRYWPDGEHARKRIGSITEIMAMQKAKEEAYANTITLADKLFANEEYESAKAEYRKAADINPFQQYPKVRMDEIDLILAEIRNKLDQYESIIVGADKLFNAGDYKEARIQYLRAQDILSDRSYPEGQIRMIDEILGLEKATREEYEAAISRGDAHFEQREWEDAKVDYVAATDLIPEEQYPKDKISEINTMLAQLKAEQETYTLTLKTADELLAANDYQAALREYEKASEIFSDEEYPRQKIEEINLILAEEAAREELQANYAGAIEEADKLLERENFSEAKEKYEEALRLMAGEAYPTEKIAEINGILAEQARLQGVEEAYAAAIDAGNTYFEGSNYSLAKTEYEKAIALKPEEEYPRTRITEIDGLLAAMAEQDRIDQAYASALGRADNLFNTTAYEEARKAYLEALEIKPEENYPKEKIEEIQTIQAELARQAKLNEDYTIALETADSFFAGKQYSEAREAYQRAAELKPDEEYPATKIAQIDTLMAQLEQERQTEEAYANAIARGDNYLSNKDYRNAKAEFESALALKANEAYPQEKISEIDTILAEEARLAMEEQEYNKAVTTADRAFGLADYALAAQAYRQALEIRNGDAYAERKLEEVNAILAEEARLAEIEENYNTAITAADAAFNARQYEEAREQYLAALAIRENGEYPAGKIREIDALIEEQARILALNQQYDKAISTADSLFALKEYESAIASYNKALALKPDEAMPAQKISEAENILYEIAQQKALDEQYAAGISEADEFLARGAYMEALEAYKDASALKPGEAYPKNKIAEINMQLEELEEERQKAFDAAIAKADSYYDLGNYRSAKASYQTALDIKSDEPYARERLDEVTILYQAELEELKAEYRQFIADADNYFNKKIYDGAIENYRLAAAILPDEDYPGRMISKITRIINDNAITDINKLAQVIPDNTSRKFPFTPLPVNVRKANYILIKAKNVSDHDFKMLINFGRDNSKNGGVVLQVPEGKQTRDYIIRIGGLYKWFSEDNNWVSVLPEGGDIEVALIRISKSD